MGNSGLIYENLIAWGPEITPEQTAEIIGNRTWSHYSCDECSADQDRVVACGGENGERELYFCTSCARALAALASAVLP